MTNKFISMMDGIRQGIASVLTPRCHRSDSLSIVSRQSLLPIFLLCLTLFIGAGQMWGAEQSHTCSGTNGTIVTSKITWAATSATWSSPQCRISANGTVAFTLTGVNVTSIAMGFSSTGYVGTWSSSGGGSFSTNNSTVTWTGTAGPGTLTFTTTAAARLKTIKVTYTNAASYTVLWTINPAAGGTLSATSGTSISVTPNAAYTYGNPAYTVTSGTATVSQSTNTFTATPSANCTIRINMVEKPKYTVTLKDDNSTLTQTSYGASVTLPSRSDCSGYTFSGWSTSNCGSSEITTPVPTVIPAGSYTSTDNINLYPVYTRSEGSAETWNKVTTLSGITAGTYVIVSDGCALQNTEASSSPARDATNYGVTISNNQITSTVSDAMKWSFTVNNSVVTIKSFANSNNYLYNGTNGNTGVRVGTTSDTWTFEENTSAPAFAMYDATKSRYCCSTVSTYNDWRSYTSADADNYRDGGKIYLFKQSGGSTTYYISEPNCCTELASINGSVF